VTLIIGRKGKAMFVHFSSAVF